MVELSILVKFAAALFAAVNPVGNVAFYISMTADQTMAEKKQTATVAFLTVAFTLVGAVFIGQPLIGAFGISISSFRVGAGLSLLLVGLKMLNSSSSPKDESQSDSHKKSVGVVPLGIPIFAGPAAISMTIVEAQNQTGFMDEILYALVALGMAGFTYMMMRFAIPVSRVLGPDGINVISRLMGLIMVALAVEIIFAGFIGTFPGLQSLT